MTRQIRSTIDMNQVAADFDLFQLPFDASLDVQGRTVYGTTDPQVNLSMVNVRHLNNSRMFRGLWQESPSDGGEVGDPGVPYIPGQVVISPTDFHLYELLNQGNAGTEPSVATEGWRQVGGVFINVQDDGTEPANGAGISVLNFGPGLDVSATANGIATITPEDLTLAATSTTGGATITLDQAGTDQTFNILAGTGITVAVADGNISITSSIEDVLGAQTF